MILLKHATLILITLLVDVIGHIDRVSSIDHQRCMDTTCIDYEQELTYVESADELRARIKNTTYYKKDRPPGTCLDPPKETEVWLVVYFESISSFQAATMDYDADILLAMAWFDHRMEHNYDDPILINDLETKVNVWTPDVYFMNSKSAYFHEVPSPNFFMLVYKDGLVFTSGRYDVTLSCMMNLAAFPMDIQECPFYIQNYAYVKSMVKLSWFEKENTSFPVATNPDIVLNDMRITNRSATQCAEFPYPLFRGHGTWSCLVGFIKMKRLILFYILQTYIPSAMLVCISWLSFWLDIRATPARIALSITTLLTLVSVSNGARQGLPQVSYIKAIDIWLSVSTGFVFSTLLQYTAICFITSQRNYTCGRHLGKTSDYPTVAKLLQDEMPTKQMNQDCKLCIIRYFRWARAVDVSSRILFPTAYLLFSAVYWYVFLSLSDE